jgi:hypothetical protein
VMRVTGIHKDINVVLEVGQVAETVKVQASVEFECGGGKREHSTLLNRGFFSAFCHHASLTIKQCTEFLTSSMISNRMGASLAWPC